MSFPPNFARGFAGNRVEAYRAGMIAITFTGDFLVKIIICDLICGVVMSVENVLTCSCWRCQKDIRVLCSASNLYTFRNNG